MNVGIPGPRPPPCPRWQAAVPVHQNAPPREWEILSFESSQGILVPATEFKSLFWGGVEHAEHSAASDTTTPIFSLIPDAPHTQPLPVPTPQKMPTVIPVQAAIDPLPVSRPSLVVRRPKAAGKFLTRQSRRRYQQRALQGFSVTNAGEAGSTSPVEQWEGPPWWYERGGGPQITYRQWKITPVSETLGEFIRDPDCTPGGQPQGLQKPIVGEWDGRIRTQTGAVVRKTGRTLTKTGGGVGPVKGFGGPQGKLVGTKINLRRTGIVRGEDCKRPAKIARGPCGSRST